MAVVIIGFILMSGGSTTTEAYNPDIFSVRRIVVAPMFCLFGFLSMIVGVMFRAKTDDADGPRKMDAEKTVIAQEKKNK